MTIDEVCRLAKAAGESYGVYVFRHREELKRPGSRRPAALRRCLCCGRPLGPTRRRYCSDFCRRLAWKQRQEGLW